MGVQGKMAWLTVVGFAVDGTTLAPQLAQTLTNSARTQLTQSALTNSANSQRSHDQTRLLVFSRKF
jgi:ABC-type enterobactin transport system permease subunit